jgi:hypothetical protein
LATASNWWLYQEVVWTAVFGGNLNFSVAGTPVNKAAAGKELEKDPASFRRKETSIYGIKGRPLTKVYENSNVGHDDECQTER